MVYLGMGLEGRWEQLKEEFPNEGGSVGCTLAHGEFCALSLQGRKQRQMAQESVRHFASAAKCGESTARDRSHRNLDVQAEIVNLKRPRDNG